MPGIDGEALLKRLPAVAGRLEPNRVLSDLTWFRVGGPAEVLFTPADEDDLSAFLQTVPDDVDVTIIGVGSNLLVRDGGVPGVVIRLGRGFGGLAVEDGYKVRAGTAVPDVKVARFALDNIIGGLTFLRGIPGTIGGALRMNGGAYGRETKDVLIEARAVDRKGNRLVLSNADMKYQYRHCGAPEDLIFTAGTVARRAGRQATTIAAADGRHHLRHGESSQPIKSRTGGSTFKNPEGGKSWQLIDAGRHARALPCRATRGVSEKHCNFLINEGGATAAQQIEEFGERR